MESLGDVHYHCHTFSDCSSKQTEREGEARGGYDFVINIETQNTYGCLCVCVPGLRLCRRCEFHSMCDL